MAYSATQATKRAGTWLRYEPAVSSRNGEVTSSTSTSSAVPGPYWRRVVSTVSTTAPAASNGSTSQGRCAATPIASNAAVPGGYWTNQWPSYSSENGIGKASSTGGGGGGGRPPP